MREERVGQCRLLLGDCRDLLGEIPREAAIVSDPPFGLGRKRGNRNGLGGCTKLAPRSRIEWRSIIGDDAPFDPSPLLGFSDAILWGANHFADRLPVSAGWLVWDKKLGIKTDDFSDGEAAWHMRGGRLRIYRKLWNGLLAHERGERRQHPDQKPIDLMRWCLGFVNAEIIADPYLGSGTTAIAALLERRPFIGIEIDEQHFTTALRRIEAVHRQTDLFLAPSAPRPEQQALFSDAAA